MHGAAHQQIAADLAAGGLGHGLVDAQLVDARTAFEVEIVQQVDDHVARGRHHVDIPGGTVAVDRRGPAAVRQERRRQSRILHRLVGCAADVLTADLAVGLVRPGVQHGDPVRHQFDMAEFFGGDAGNETVERSQFGLAAKVKALKQIIVESSTSHRICRRATPEVLPQRSDLVF